MYRVGVIGTSDIVTKSVQAFLNTQRALLVAVYSRQVETGKKFAEAFGDVSVNTNLDDFVNRDDIDIVYIASPNTFHFEQAQKAILAKKHVVVEKPAVVTLKQWEILQQIAKENQVYLFEAIRHAYEPNFKKLTQLLQSKKLMELF